MTTNWIRRMWVGAALAAAVVSLSTSVAAAAPAVSAAPYPDCHDYVSITKIGDNGTEATLRITAPGASMRALMSEQYGLIYLSGVYGDGSPYNVSWSGTVFTVEANDPGTAIAVGLSVTNDDASVTYCSGTYSVTY